MCFGCTISPLLLWLKGTACHIVPLQQQIGWLPASPSQNGYQKDTQKLTEHKQNIWKNQKMLVFSVPKRRMLGFFPHPTREALKKLDAWPGPGIGGVAAGVASGVASGVATGVTGADMEGIGDGSQALGVASKTRKGISRNTDSLNLSAFQV